MTTLKNLISMKDISRTDIERLIRLANKLRKKRATKRTLPNFILGLLFFQESTRTQIGFQTAAYRLWGQVFALKETKFTKYMSSAETIEDTLRVLQSYADIICIRDSNSNVFSRLTPYAKKPLINCGNGADEHPTQALIDLMTIYNLRGTLDGLKIAIVGNLQDMRTSHSLLFGLANFTNISVTLISPRQLRMPSSYIDTFKQKNLDNKIQETESLDLKGNDIIYVTGFPAKTKTGVVSKVIRKKYQINTKVLAQLSPNSYILDPLPREDEISMEVDSTPFAKYFTQSENGLYMRMAILSAMIDSKRE